MSESSTRLANWGLRWGRCRISLNPIPAMKNIAWQLPRPSWTYVQEDRSWLTVARRSRTLQESLVDWSLERPSASLHKISSRDDALYNSLQSHKRSRLGPSGTSHGDICVRREVAQICPKAGSRCEASPPSTKRKERFRTRWDRWVGSVSIAASERETLASPETLLLGLHA